MTCAPDHEAAKASEQAFRRAMRNVREAAPIHGRGGLFGECPVCHSTCMYRRRAPGKDSES